MVVEVVAVVMGRPKIPGESVYVRLDPELAEELTRYVREQDGPARTTKNSVINFALKKFFEDLQKNA